MFEPSVDPSQVAATCCQRFKSTPAVEIRLGLAPLNWSTANCMRFEYIEKNQPASLLSLSTILPRPPPPDDVGRIQALTVTPPLYRFARLPEPDMRTAVPSPSKLSARPATPVVHCGLLMSAPSLPPSAESAALVPDPASNVQKSTAELPPCETGGLGCVTVPPPGGESWGGVSLTFRTAFATLNESNSPSPENTAQRLRPSELIHLDGKYIPLPAPLVSLKPPQSS